LRWIVAEIDKLGVMLSGQRFHYFAPLNQPFGDQYLTQRCINHALLIQRINQIAAGDLACLNKVTPQWHRGLKVPRNLRIRQVKPQITHEHRPYG
jgi:hypothetical protein